MSARRRSGLWPWAAVAACFCGAFVLAAFLTAAAPVPTPGNGGGVANLLLGGSRRALSAGFYEQADTYFHRGVGHRENRVERQDWIRRLHDDVSPEEHRHTEGGDAVELIPWLRLATQADPHNVEAWLVAAFWIESGLQRPDLAEQVLRDAQRHNPGDYRVLLDRARLYVRSGRFAEAANVLDAALARWPGSLDPEDRQSMLDKAEMLTYRAFLHEMDGHLPEAAAAFKNVLAIFPGRTYIESRLRELETGKAPADPARVLLERGVRHVTRQTCDGEKTHEHQGHGDPPTHQGG